MKRNDEFLGEDREFLIKFMGLEIRRDIWDGRYLGIDDLRGII